MIPLRNFARFYQKALKQPGYAWRVMRKRLAAYQSYARCDGRSAAPEAITLYLTRLCNLRCRMCGQWGDAGVYKKDGRQTMEDGREHEKELSFEKILKLLDDVRTFKPSITLFGGEPMLHPSCVEIIRAIKQRGMHCLMITNGSLLEPNASLLARSGLDELNVSIDGLREIHDRIRSRPGLYDTVMRGLAALRAERRGSFPLVNIQCTISEYNQGHLGEMAQVAREAGADSLTFHHLIFISPDVLSQQRKQDQSFENCSRDWEGFVSASRVDTDIIWSGINSVSRQRRSFDFDVYPRLSFNGMRAYYREAANTHALRCRSPWLTAYVFPEGDLRPCLNFSYSFGNIVSASFGEVWNGKRACDYRLRLKKEKSFAACARCTELYRY